MASTSLTHVARPSSRGLLERLRHPTAGTRALIGTTAGSLPGFLFPFVLSWRFGAGALTDAYFLSFAIATFVAGVLSNVLEVAMIPAVAAQARGGASGLLALVRKTLLGSVGVATLAYIPTALIGVAIVHAHHGWSPSQRSLCVALILIFGLYILATALTSVLDGALYALGQFFIPTLSQCMRTLLPLAFIVLIEPSSAGVIVIACLLVGGELLRGALLARMLHSRAHSLKDANPAPHRSRLLESSLPLAMSLIVVAVSPLIDKLVASPLGSGSVTLIELAEKVFYVPVLALSSSVVLVAGSRWASLSLERPDAIALDFRRTLARVLWLSGAAAAGVALIVTVATLCAGRRLLGLDSGHFRLLVLLFLAGLPAAIVIAQGARLMTALQRTRLLPLFALSAFTVNLAGDILGAHLFGLDGIALASTLFRCVNAVLYVWACTLLLRALSRKAAKPTPFLLR